MYDILKSQRIIRDNLDIEISSFVPHCFNFQGSSSSSLRAPCTWPIMLSTAETEIQLIGVTCVARIYIIELRELGGQQVLKLVSQILNLCGSDRHSESG
jgi:hypothetical protein